MTDEVRRRTWRHRPLDADSAARPGGESATATLETLAQRHALWALLTEITGHMLTPRQRRALVGRIIEEKPFVVLAAELGTDKDNVYKLLHDARAHLKRALVALGLSASDVFAAFEGKAV